MELFRIFSTAFNAIAPIVLLMGLGYLLRQKGMFNQNFLAFGNKLVFRLLLPALLFANVAVGSETMADQMGNDGQLATQLVVWSSILSILTLFLTVCVMMLLGFLPV